ncbi:pilus assembly protein FilA [Acinetobacter haemolyticus]|jgi:hypothetical protein|uniref:putative pilus system protein FilA n=1 Tax=unclassified Acinetobacter TaxID=196816 RepID=UPI0015D1457F|nr:MULTISPECIES: DUF6160 family protein [unclassified Acinetobacter]QQN38815.1 pilus assembly protein FilA [Acinetobacter sp. CS-2]UDM38804.1 pilus assembly protein FilA [Acinetobacter haemolyticus]
MKKFTKLALVSSLAISANAMAMQAMDDASLGATTGQDGINIGIGISRITIDKLFVHDNDGLSTKDATGTVIPTTALGGTGNAGAISIKGAKNSETITLTNGGTIDRKDQGIFIGANYQSLLATGNLADLQIDSDAGSGSGNTAFINIAAQVSGLEIHIGEIGVTASGANDPAVNIRRGGNDSNYNAILSGLSVKTGKMTANIQLGAAPQGAMIKLDSVMQGGLEIKNLGILDNSTNGAVVAVHPTAGPISTTGPGEIFIESIKVADANSTNLTMKASVSVFGESAANKGFVRIVSTNDKIDNYVKGIHLGSRTAGSIGDVEVQGLQTFYGASYDKGSMISISGH